MRDPVLFRVIEAKHPLLGDRYRVWPSYDFAVAIEDSVDGVTHAFRSKEYELRNELYYSILDALKMRKPRVLEFSRLEFKGMPVSKRVLKPLIEEGKIPWYDDPRLPTLEGLKRRGITPEAIRKFILSLGFTKSDTLAPFDALESFNRKIVDGNSIRLFMVQNPQKLIVKNLPSSFVELPNHPTKDMGKRKVEVDENLLLSLDDTKKLNPGDKIRLMGLGNITLTKTDHQLEGEFTGDDMDVDYPKLQWIPQKNCHQIKMLIPKQLFFDEEYNEDSLEEVDVYTEPYFLELRQSSEIQFVRFGYCRKDSQNQVIFTHK
ncbi:MAG: Glutamyl-tRNA synthetase [Nitrosopumilales archaeon]|nr:MAG: Glutamyl-tRNA synthetase [Nitrosopumilales archaeon]